MNGLPKLIHSESSTRMSKVDGYALLTKLQATYFTTIRQKLKEIYNEKIDMDSRVDKYANKLYLTFELKTRKNKMNYVIIIGFTKDTKLSTYSEPVYKGIRIETDHSYRKLLVNTITIGKFKERLKNVISDHVKVMNKNMFSFISDEVALETKFELRKKEIAQFKGIPTDLESTYKGGLNGSYLFQDGHVRVNYEDESIEVRCNRIDVKKLHQILKMFTPENCWYVIAYTYEITSDGNNQLKLKLVNSEQEIFCYPHNITIECSGCKSPVIPLKDNTYAQCMNNECGKILHLDYGHMEYKVIEVRPESETNEVVPADNE